MGHEIIRKGEKFVFRLPRISDAKNLMEYINSLVEERAPILKDVKVNLREEKKWLKSLLSEIKSKKKVAYVVEHKKSGNIVGMCNITKGNFAASHIGNLGIAIKKEFRGIGLGKALMNYTIEQAKKKLNIEMVTLSVFKNNKIAISLYKKLGFKVYGELKRGLKRDGKYYDEILMYKRLL